ncbi:MAG: hypothetical protein ACTSRP_23070 [Candidatus Helarchaeota archaeon]
MNIDLNYLKSISIELPERRLRLPIELFKIKIKNKIFRLKTIFKINKTIDKKNVKFIIRENIKDVLFDTGNELNYSCVSEYCYDNFKKVSLLDDGDFKWSIMGSIREDKKIYVRVSKDKFLFYFKNEPIFYSKIGFLSNIAKNWLYTINFGIECVRQFFSILLPNKDRLYFYLKRI